MVILMLFFIVFSIVAAVNIFANLFQWSDIADRIANYINEANPYVALAVLILILLISLIILVFEFYRRKIKVANITADNSGRTMVTLKTVSDQVKESINNIEDMHAPLVKIIPKNDGIIINIFSKIAIGVNVLDKTKEIRETATNFASNNLGFRVLQTNYTATGFIQKQQKAPEEIKTASEVFAQGKQADEKKEYPPPSRELEDRIESDIAQSDPDEN